MVRRLNSLLLVVALGTSVAVAAEPFRVRVLSYNIHHAEGVDGELDLARIAKVIRSVSPDVVALQEVDDQVRRSGHVKQPAELARLTKMHVVFEKNIDYQGGRYGNAVLSRFPFVQHRNVHLPSFDRGEQRGVLICKLRLPSRQQPLLFLGTHLDHRRQDRERLASAERINALSDAYAQQPALLVGDLNATRESAVLARFQKNWQIVHREELPTVPVGKPSRQIDFILARPAGAWKTVEVRVLEEAVASDHRALFAVLEWGDSQ
ncbi:MAG: endonuclease/exonuclease/phosphatase family protein [Planctomycetota bacterium]|nr:endonuclease/exonuclease/phosphatase family protein [Planctomycetota bacterium]